MIKSLSIYNDKNIAKIFFYGLICGIGLLLSGNTINFWLASNNINTKIIGFFSFIALPYALKYFIALFIDRHNFSCVKIKITSKKNWLIFSQIMLALILILTSLLNPKQHLLLIALSGFFTALFTTITDIILNSNRIEILDSKKQPAGTATYTIGYRLGMLISGAGVIFLSSYLNWSTIYLILGLIYSFSLVILLYIFVEKYYQEDAYKVDEDFYHKIFISPFKHLTLKYFIWSISFIIIYRLADNMLVIMLNPFFISLGFTATEIASISKFFGTIMVIIGGIISGPIITKINIRNSVIYFSVLHMLGHILYIALNYTGKNIPLLYFITAYESLTGGMVMTAYITFMSQLCQGKHVATQYSLLSSGMGLSRVLFPMLSGVIVDYYQWNFFFSIIITISISVIIFTIYMPKHLYKTVHTFSDK